MRRNWVVVPRRERVFALPNTHRLDVHGANGEDRVAFLAQCFGFLVGMRMSTTEAGFLDTTAIRPGMLNDFILGGNALAEGLNCADEFWKQYAGNVRIAKALSGVIHTLMLAHDPTLLGYERFLYLYTALDGCYFVYKARPGSQSAQNHGARLTLLCGELGTHQPAWLGDVVTARNETIHEGLFFGEPLGFRGFGRGGSAVPPRTPWEMMALVCRFVVALLEIPAPDYIGSPVDSRDRRMLR